MQIGNIFRVEPVGVNFECGHRTNSRLPLVHRLATLGFRHLSASILIPNDFIKPAPTDLRPGGYARNDLVEIGAFLRITKHTRCKFCSFQIAVLIRERPHAEFRF